MTLSLGNVETVLCPDCISLEKSLSLVDSTPALFGKLSVHREVSFLGTVTVIGENALPGQIAVTANSSFLAKYLSIKWPS
jgi:hypothetical protein